MNISKDNISGIKNIPGVNVTSCIVPCTEKDNYPTHDSQYGIGGWREVRTIEERNAIPVERRRLGMAVYVTTLGKLYILRYALNDTCWHEFNPIDVSGIINDAIANGNINIDLTGCITPGQLADALIEYAKKEDVEFDIESAKDDLKEWVAEQNYLTEHQSLEDYVTIEFARGLVDILTEYVEGELNTIKDDIETLNGQVEELNTFAEKVGDLSDLEDTLVEKVNTLENAITEVKDTIDAYPEYVEKEEYDTFIDIANVAHDRFNDFINVAPATYVSYDNLNDTLEGYVKVGDIDVPDLKTALEGYVSKDNLDETLRDAGYIDEAFLRGFATESWVKDYLVAKGYVDTKFLRGFATESWVQDYVRLHGGTSSNSGAGNVEIDLTGYQKQRDIGLDTTDKTIVGAINEINEKCSQVPDAVYSKTEADNKFLTEHQDISDLATKEELQDAIDGIVHPATDLTNYVTKDDLQEAIEAIPAVELDGYAKIEDLDDFVTGEWVENKGYLTEHQDISGLATKEELQDAIDELEIPEVDLTGLATKQELQDAIDGIVHPAVNLEGYATEEWVEGKNYLTTHQDISGLATKEELQDAIDNIDIPEVDLTDYAKSADVYSKEEANSTFLKEHQSLAGLATEEWVTNKNYLTEHQSLEDYAKAEDVYSKEDADAKFLTEHQSLAGYATEAFVTAKISEVTGGVTGVVSVEEYNAKMAEYDQTIATQAEQIAAQEERISTLEGQLTAIMTSYEEID